jgi:hypothetical protein
MNKFKVGQTVIYQNGSSFELGIVKEVIEREKRTYLRQQGYPPNGEPQGELFKYYEYRIWYHTGDTSAITSESNLHEIVNEYAFLILRRKVDPSVLGTTDARILANEILMNLNSYVHATIGQPLFSDEDDDGLLGPTYLSLEDETTKFINEYKKDTVE